MDLRSIINNEAGENVAPKQQVAPVTPIQIVPPGPGQQGFRDYSRSSQASPGKHPSQDFTPSHSAGGPFASPTTYQGTYPGRPPPPTPIQPPQNDLRSPAGSYSAQSPYRNTPTSSISGQYPFPQSYPAPQSPAQHPQYPPSFPHRDSYPQPNHPPPHLQTRNSQPRASPGPQTPPIGIPGAPHPYLQHQRSQSSVSNSTPTSAQSQPPPYFNQYTHDSPVSAGPFPLQQIPQHHRHPSQQSQNSQHSQPGTPLGPPLPTAQRQSSSGFIHPTSPYQQRGMSAGFGQFQQTSPAPPPASIPKQPTTPRSAYNSQRTSTSSTQQRSISERERSLSVSPKTRLPSQPREATIEHQLQDHLNNTKHQMNLQIEENTNIMKRKMDDREAPVEQPRRVEQYDVKPQVNGDYQSNPAVSSPQQPAKKRVRYTEPPIWAQSITGRTKNSFGAANRKLNGRQSTFTQQPAPAASAFIKSETNGHRQATPSTDRSAMENDSVTGSLLGAWEPSIMGTKPIEEMTKVVADFLWGLVVSRPDIGELASRGVEIEIEAKLGQLINKETNIRYQLPIATECIVQDPQRMTFRSSMTEDQHKNLNQYLNDKVKETYPSNPQPKRRVQIDYKHRREIDKFYELPASAQSILPAAVRSLLNPRHAVKVRVSHDQKTNEVLAKIVKARIADLDILLPRQPLDCRISVNLEMRYDGDIDSLAGGGDEAKRPDRNKDRVSYTQSHYQIDLTQVTQGTSRIEKEHELEIEVSTAAIREQGLLAASGDPANEYMNLVEGLLDNVRVLARQVGKMGA